MQRFLFILLSGLAISCLLGCGTSKPDTFLVKGTVTLDGQPIPKGDIVLLSPNGDVAPNAGKIVDGVFEFRSLPGVKRVEIQASKPGKPDPGMQSPNMVSYIPAQYNLQSKLTLEVKPDNENQHEFALTSDTVSAKKTN